MKLTDISPFIRYAAVHNQIVSRKSSKTYDCRLHYILDGTGAYRLGNQSFSIAPDMLIFYQPGTLYSLMPEPSYRCIALDFDFTRDYANETHFLPPVSAEEFDVSAAHEAIWFTDFDIFRTPLVLERAFSLRNPLLELTEEFVSGKLFSAEKSSLMLKNILLETVRLALANSRKSRICESVFSYIHAHIGGDLSNAHLGRILNLDPGYLNRIVKSRTGLSLHQNVIRHRVQAATRLLLNTDLPIEEIAAQTGFYDTAHFSACFKKQTGSPPSYYRKG